MDPSLSTLSSLGQVLATKPLLPYVEAIVKSINDTYDPGSNPNGKILMAVAENKLLNKELIERIQAVASQCFEKNLLNYTANSGLPSFKQVLSVFLSQHVFKNCNINPDHLVISPGCCGCITQLSLMLFEPGDSVLIPTPYYPAFDKYFSNLAKVKVIEVNTGFVENEHNPFAPITTDALEAAYSKAMLTGHPPKAVLLTNPSNPLGIIYSSTEVQTIIDWCHDKQLHLIADEIYSLSIYKDDHKQFTSVATLRNNHLGNNIHLVWSFSKDFGASGLRVGVCYTQNPKLLAGMAAINDAMQVSNIVQDLLASLISDTDFISTFINHNQRLLLQSYNVLQQQLALFHIPIINASGGIFAFADFRSLLATNTFKAERELFQQLIEYGIVLTPGEVCHCPIPGFFRICYAWVSVDVLIVGIQRIKLYYDRMRYVSDHDNVLNDASADVTDK